MPGLLRKDEKTKVNLEFVSKEQINTEMDALLKHYGAKRSQASLDKTRKILKRFGSVNDELAAMRDENKLNAIFGLHCSTTLGNNEIQ